MQPTPTHFVVNVGLWAFSDAFAHEQMPLVVRAFRRVAKHVVWRETSQPSGRSLVPGETLTFQRWKAKQHVRQRIDAVMYNTLCSVHNDNDNLIVRRNHSASLLSPVNTIIITHAREATTSASNSTSHAEESEAKIISHVKVLQLPLPPPLAQLQSPPLSLCHYFSLPPIPGAPVDGLMPPDMFGDHVHPMPFQYKFWNARLWLLLMSLR